MFARRHGSFLIDTSKFTTTITFVNTSARLRSVLEMFEITRAAKKVHVDESDVISISEAARISGRRIPEVADLINRFRLPWYQLRQPDSALESEDVQRFTSRKAVEALPPKKLRRSTIPPFKNKR